MSVVRSFVPHLPIPLLALRAADLGARLAPVNMDASAASSGLVLSCARLAAEAKTPVSETKSTARRTRPKRRRALIIGALLYGAAWLATALIGCPQAARTAQESLQVISLDDSRFAERQLEKHEQLRKQTRLELQSSGNQDFDGSMRDRDPSPLAPDNYPTFWASTWSPAPLIVILEQGRQLAPLAGSGRTTLQVWLFGRLFELGTWGAWIS